VPWLAQSTLARSALDVGAATMEGSVGVARRLAVGSRGPRLLYRPE
jgi:hypothetical protein